MHDKKCGWDERIGAYNSRPEAQEGNSRIPGTGQCSPCSRINERDGPIQNSPIFAIREGGMKVLARAIALLLIIALPALAAEPTLHEQTSGEGHGRQSHGARHHNLQKDALETV